MTTKEQPTQPNPSKPNDAQDLQAQVVQPKPFWQSKTIKVNTAITLAPVLIGLISVLSDESFQDTALSLMKALGLSVDPTVVGAIIIILSGIANLWLRAITNEPVALKKDNSKKPEVNK